MVKRANIREDVTTPERNSKRAPASERDGGVPRRYFRGSLELKNDEVVVSSSSHYSHVINLMFVFHVIGES